MCWCTAVPPRRSGFRMIRQSIRCYFGSLQHPHNESVRSRNMTFTPKRGHKVNCIKPFRNYKQLGILGVRVWLWSFMLRLHTFAFECLQKVVNTTVFGKGKPAGMSNPGYVWTKTVFKVLQARNKKEQTLQVVCIPHIPPQMRQIQNFSFL